MTDAQRILENRLQRERKARKQAEQLLEGKSRELYEANTSLQNLANNLEKLVAERTLELTMLRDQALAASQVKSAFLANMSHEIRTPISGVIGMAELLLESPLSEEQISQVQVILNESNALLQIINDILDLSKLESGKLELDSSDFDLCKLLDDLVDTLAKPANDKNLVVGAVVHSPVPAMLHADPLRLRQILMNLLSNAIKFTDEGAVRLEVNQVSDDTGAATLRFTVTDSGIGISEQDQCHLFKKFRQLGHNKRPQPNKGTGLGLSICKTLVEKMQGQIGCNSLPGQGSTFWFTLPLSAQAEHAAKPDYSNCSALCVVIADNSLRQLVATQAAYLDIKCHLYHDIDTLLEMLSDMGTGIENNFIVLLDAEVLEQASDEQCQALNRRSAALSCLIYQLGSASSSDDRIRIECRVNRPLTHRKLTNLIQPIQNARLPTPPRQAKHSHARILLVEDTPSLQLVTKAMLQKAGYEVSVESNGREAINAVSTGQFDLVLMDIQMPEMDGIEATRRIRQLPAPLPSDIPIVALTAFAMKGDEQEFLQAGMNDYMTKPIAKSALDAVLSRWLNRDQQDRRTS